MVRYRGDSPGDTTVSIERFCDGKFQAKIEVGYKFLGWYTGYKCKIEYAFKPDSGTVILGDEMRISANKITYGKGVWESMEADREREEAKEAAEREAKWENRLK